jgi:hypothetical protein
MLYLLKQQDSNKVNVFYYGIGGEQFSTDDVRVLAKKVVGKRTQYFVKYNTAGVEAGHMVNPWSMYADESVRSTNKIDPHTGKPYQQYKEVHETAFQLYMSYLENRSDLHYRQAERVAMEYAF